MDAIDRSTLNLSESFPVLARAPIIEPGQVARPRQGRTASHHREGVMILAGGILAGVGHDMQATPSSKR